MKRDIHYIVAVYLGERANQFVNDKLKDPLFLVKLHLEALKKFKVSDIKKVTFVVSPSFSERDNCVVDFVKSKSNEFHDIQINAYIKPTNEYYSYGSWDHCMQMHLDDDLDFFLIEDDYLPARDQFYSPFQEALDEKTAYVCQLYTKILEIMNHAAISNGILNLKAAREHFDTFGNCISIPRMVNTTKYNPGVIAQMGFLDHFPKLGFIIKDVSVHYNHPFLQTSNGIVKYGNTRGETLIEPYTRFIEN